MKIAVVGETKAFERRVALVPGLVPRLTDVGHRSDPWPARAATVWGAHNVPSQLPGQASEL